VCVCVRIVSPRKGAKNVSEGQGTAAHTTNREAPSWKAPPSVGRKGRVQQAAASMRVRHRPVRIPRGTTTLDETVSPTFSRRAAPGRAQNTDYGTPERSTALSPAAYLSARFAQHLRFATGSPVTVALFIGVGRDNNSNPHKTAPDRRRKQTGP